MTKMPLAEHNNVVKALPSDRTDQSFSKSLERQNILTPSEGLTDRRKSVPTLLFNPPKNTLDISE
jgi:hypothetical protein